jgi:hypothetical protein
VARLGAGAAKAVLAKAMREVMNVAFIANCLEVKILRMV